MLLKTLAITKKALARMAVAGAIAVCAFGAGYAVRDALILHHDDYKVISCTSVEYDDGDSFFCRAKGEGENGEGIEVRVLGIDTPEIIHKDQGICFDQEYGREAAAYARQIFEKAKSIEVIIVDTDKYRRKLSHVLVDGELFAPKMIRAGLAYQSIEHYGDNGFPGLAIEMMGAWNSVQKPLPFIEPWKWREIWQYKDGTVCK